MNELDGAPISNINNRNFLLARVKFHLPDNEGSNSGQSD